MNQVEKSVREKIIIAAIACIEEQGIHAITIRAIAKEAGVNSAAINYYFGSKEKLLDETLRHATRHALGDAVELATRRIDNPYLSLCGIFSFLLQGMLRYPGLMKAFFYNSFVLEDYKGIFIQQLMTLLDDLLKRLEPLVAEADRANLRLSVTQICSSIFFIGLFPRWYQDSFGFDFSFPESQKEFIAHLFRHYFTSAQFEDIAKSQKLDEMIEYYFNNQK